MNLLLFFSAWLTGLTGAIAGGHGALAPSVQHSVAQVCEVAAKTSAGVSVPSRFRSAATFTLFEATQAILPHRAAVSASPGSDLFRICEKRLI